jgi:hypothetical protein
LPAAATPRVGARCRTTEGRRRSIPAPCPHPSPRQ